MTEALVAERGTATRQIRAEARSSAPILRAVGTRSVIPEGCGRTHPLGG